MLLNIKEIAEIVNLQKNYRLRLSKGVPCNHELSLSTSFLRSSLI